MKDQGEVTAFTVTESRGIQVGSGNVQNNTWIPKPPPDLATLSVLNPDVAVARLNRMSHDDLVDLFAGASPEEAIGVLAAFLEADEDALIAILGDISRHQTTQLIRQSISVASRLGNLTEAAEAIARKGTALRWTQAGVLERSTTDSYSGYSREYRNGRIFWHGRHGAWAVSGAIDDYRTDRAWLGFPTGDQQTAPSSPFGTNGVRQSFECGTVYASNRGAFSVGNLRRYEEEGESAGWLGFPDAEAMRYGHNRFQSFEGGLIASTAGQGGREYAIRRKG